MTISTIYKPTYNKSWAIVIGINDYRVASPLEYARQDAESFAETLTSAFGFPQEGVTVLLDGGGTRQGILSSFLELTKGAVSPDDRVAFFFAGHGCTRTGKRGEVGFLVPVDGDPNELSTLIRWNELTGNAELIPAKHVLFVMDACYGGLAIQRNIPAGSARFLKDMLQRYSRQVLTAGKADETVADSGGPRPGHSIFTGHLLDALEGKAADSNGIISANAVMTYVYDHVGKDPHSRQSPHFGFIEGDGDFIFSAPKLAELTKDKEEDKDVLVQVPASVGPSNELSDRQALVDRAKDYLSDTRYRIRLDDLVASEIRAASYEIREEEFPLNSPVSPEDSVQRLRRYNSALSRLNAITILLGRWGTAEHQPLIERIVARLTDGTEPRSGRVVWLGLRWYPIMLLLYSGGIAALSGHNYKSLATLLMTRLRGSTTGRDAQPAVIATVKEILELERADFFKTLPGHERQYAARSEYLFKSLQPEIEDLLFLGNSYEDLFDRFEIFYALTYVDLSIRTSGYLWGPPGRFGWKGRLGSASPYGAITDEAKQQGVNWTPLLSGLFAGSVDRFNEIASAYREQVLDKLPWF